MHENKHAAAILALPAAQHPKLTALAHKLAGDPRFTADDAETLLKAAAKDADVSKLDIEMAQPGNNVAVPFAAQGKPMTKEQQFQQMVSENVTRMLGGRP
jgi:hypothetical protein